MRPAAVLTGAISSAKLFFLFLFVSAIAQLAAGAAAATSELAETIGKHFARGEYVDRLREIDHARAAKSIVPDQEAETILLDGICQERLGHQADADRAYLEVEARFPGSKQAEHANARIHRLAGDQKGWLQPELRGTKWGQYETSWQRSAVGVRYMPEQARHRRFLPVWSGPRPFLPAGDPLGATRTAESARVIEWMYSYATDSDGADLETWGPRIESWVSAKCPGYKWNPVKASDTEIIETFESGDCQTGKRVGVLRILLQGTRACYIVYFNRSLDWSKHVQEDRVKLVSSVPFVAVAAKTQ